MKKIVLVTLGLVFIAPTAYSASLSQGTKTIKGSASWDFDTPNGDDFSAEAGYGYFIGQDLELGGELGFGTNDVVDSWDLGVYGNFYVPVTPQFSPYIGAGLGVSNTELNYGRVNEDSSALVMSLNGGALFFITQQLALDGRLNLRFASDDIYPDERDADSSDTRLLFGLKYFFN